MQNIYVNFQKLPIKIYELGLDVNEFAVLSYLFSLSNNKNIHPSKETIGSKTNLSRRVVDKAINSLVKRGFLEYNRGYTKGKLKVCNQYHIRIEKIDPTCTLKSQKQTDRENENENNEEYKEIVKQEIEKLGS